MLHTVEPQLRHAPSLSLLAHLRENSEGGRETLETLDHTRPTCLFVELLFGLSLGMHCLLRLLESSRGSVRGAEDPVRSSIGPEASASARDHPAFVSLECQTLKAPSQNTVARSVGSTSSVTGSSPQTQPASPSCPHPLLRLGEWTVCRATLSR